MSRGRCVQYWRDRSSRPTDLSGLTFSTTAELQPVDGLVGQARAVEAIRFGTQVSKTGFNLFVIGPNGARMQDAVKAMLATEAAGKPGPSDWVYVNNFADPDKPVAIELPAGRARNFHDAMHKLIDDLKSALPAVFQGEDYQRRQAAIDESFQKRQGEAFSALRDRAAEKDIAILRTPLGFALAPIKNGEVVPPDEFSKWPEAKRREVQAVIEALEKELEHIVRQIPRWETERRDEARQLGRDTAKYAVDQLIEDTKDAFKDLPRVVQHVETVRADLIENFAMFVLKGEDDGSEAREIRTGGPFDRYEVNVLVTQDGDKSVPIVEELHPALGNLIGRIEYIPLHGALLTNFRLIKAGAMHRANGGYLLLDARSVLQEPFSWAALKRTLRRGEIAIEDISRFLGFTSTVSLEPDPIPLKLKVILFGDRLLYFLLAALDPELAELAARSIERKFMGAAKRLPTGYQFEVARGSLAKTFASVSRRDDIVMIVEPQSPAERATQQFAWLLEAAFRSAAAVMLFPPQIVRARGAVVAIAASPDDPSIHAAAAIASAAKEELVVIAADGHGADDTRIRKLAADTGLSIKHVAAASLKLSDPAAYALAFRQIQERLIVMTRSAFADQAASEIAAARRVPVLVVEPEQVVADETMPRPTTMQ